MYKQVTRPERYSLFFTPPPSFTSHWDPSYWCPWLTPPAGRTGTTRSKRSDREDRKALDSLVCHQHHGVPSLRHAHLCHKLVDQVHLKEGKKDLKVTEQVGLVCPVPVTPLYAWLWSHQLWPDCVYSVDCIFWTGIWSPALLTQLIFNMQKTVLRVNP